MDKELNQAIIVRSKLRKKVLKIKTEENRLVTAKVITAKKATILWKLKP